MTTPKKAQSPGRSSQTCIYEKLIDLEEAIQVARQAVEASPESDPDRAARLNDLALCLHKKYLRTGIVIDLNNAVDVAWQAVNATPVGCSDRMIWLNNLADCLGDKFYRTGELEDLEKSIEIIRQVVHTTPENHLGRATMLNNLGLQLSQRYSRLGEIRDIEEAIQVSRKAIDATPEVHFDRVKWLNNLGLHLGKRYSRSGQIEDLEEAIQVVWKAISATPADDPHRPTMLDNVGLHLSERYSKTATLADLEEAVQLTRQAIHLTPENHPIRLGFLSNLGLHLGKRYTRMGAMKDIEEAIQVAQRAVDMTVKDHPDRTTMLDNLGLHLNYRYQGTGEINDLEEAIQFTRQVADITPKNHPDRPRSLNNLGLHVIERYSRLGAMKDLDEAIQVTRQAIDATPEGHPDRLSRLHSLGIRLSIKYSRTGEINELEEAIKVTRQAIQSTPKDHPNQVNQLNTLGIHLGKKYSKTGNIEYLDEAIQVARQAAISAQKGHPNRARSLYNLGLRFGDRYLKTREMNELEEAIQVIQQAVDATPENHLDRAERLYTLGNHLCNRYLETRAMIDFKNAVICLESALRSCNAPTIMRIFAGARLVQLFARVMNWSMASEYSTMAVKLIPSLVARSLENSDKQHMLSQVVGLACDASAAASNAGRVPLVALNLLEQGRGVLATSLDEMRTDITELRAKRPALAERFINLRNELQLPPTGYTSSLEQSYMLAPKTQADRRQFASSELDRLIAEIQQQPGFEDFLRPPSEEEILSASTYGPIVVINVSQYGCDAILVHQRQIQSVHLPNLAYKVFKEKVQQGSLGSPQVLEWLWDAVTLPILDALGFTEPPPDDEWPHVWWIPTGPLNKFPLHAAGYHGKGLNCTVLDRVMSSYSSSIKALIHGRLRRSLQDDSKVPAQALLVALQDTPNQERLYSAKSEVNMLDALCDPSYLHPVQLKQLRKEDVVAQLPSCKIFHFAGHGHTDDTDPSKSSLLLEDWENDPLTVANLLEMNLREHAPFLAYLSACGTGEIRDERFFDESIHLISACQLVGFRHVIGTLWKVNDEICVDMAETTYKEMIREGMTDESVCLGLHKASRKLRDRWLRQLKDFRYKKRLSGNAESDIVEEKKEGGRDGRDSRLPRKVNPSDSDEENDEPLHWVPYVHYGV